MKKTVSSLIGILVSLCLLIPLCSNVMAGEFRAAEQIEDETPTKTDSAIRTVMLYGVGSNLETNYGMLTWNLVQILEADIPEDVNVVVMTGGSYEWQTEPEYLEGADAIGIDAHNQFWICSGKNAKNAENGHGKMTLLSCPEQFENASMSEPETLQAFIDYSVENYPAELYDLFLWDHGGGPHGGFGIDQWFEDDPAMSLGEIVSALKYSKADHFDIIDFDACLMSSVEIVAALAQFTDYLILSPETEPGYGQEYTTWLNALADNNTTMDGFELGKIIADACIAFYEDESTEGYGQDATLSVINTKNFKKRMFPLLTQLAQTMNREITEVGKQNLLLNFTDEFRVLPMTYKYFDEALIDIGSLSNHLGICMSEITNYSSVFDIESAPNAYTDITQNINEILLDQDDSGDDVIYNRYTEGTIKQVFADVQYVRNEDGELENETAVSPKGLSLFFDPLDISGTLNYFEAMEKVCDLISDEETEAMLREFELANARYVLAVVSGYTVDELLDAGSSNVYYKTVRDSWQELREMNEMEIAVYKEQMGLDAAITGIESSDWKAYVSTLIEFIDKYSDEDTETWLALLAAQQSSEAVRADRAAAEPVDKNGDGNPDAYRVIVGSPQGLVKDVAMNIQAEGIELPDDWVESFGSSVTLGKFRGSLSLDTLISNLAKTQSLYASLMNFYNMEESEYYLDAAVDRWYELVDSEGNGHLISVGEVDLEHDTELRIPVIIQLNKYDEYGDKLFLKGYFVYSNGRIIGFSEEFCPTPLIPLSDKQFDGALVSTCQTYGFDFIGIQMHVFGEISSFFELPMERTNDRGMSVVLSPVSEIADLINGAFVVKPVITDLYGYEHDLRPVLEDAKNNASEGQLLKSIKGADITVYDLTAEVEYQKPEVSVVYNGNELVPDEDFIVLVEDPEYFGSYHPVTGGPGVYTGVICGIGEYCDYVPVTITVIDESPEEAEQPEDIIPEDFAIEELLGESGEELQE